MIVLPGVLSLVLLGLLAYAYAGGRSPYFKTWLMAWGCYSASCLSAYPMYAERGPQLLFSFLSVSFMSAAMLLIFSSTFVAEASQPPERLMVPLVSLLAGWSALLAFYNVRHVGASAIIVVSGWKLSVDIAIAWSALLLASGWRLLRSDSRKDRGGYRLLGGALIFWAILQMSRPLLGYFPGTFPDVGHEFVPVVQLLISLAMLMTLYEDEKVDSRRTLAALERRTREFEALTEIGQAVSSQLSEHEIFMTAHKELGRLVDTRNFYVAFREGNEIIFAFECTDGVIDAPRSRPLSNGFTEYILRARQPLLVERGMESVRAELGVVAFAKPARCFCGVPIVINGETTGVMAALAYDKEDVYTPRDMEMLETAARQLSIAVENARLFEREKRRARYFAFLNKISKMAISSQDAEQMLAQIARELQQNFPFEHIGVGILDYNSKEIVIKAEASHGAKALGKRIPLGVGILGRVARTNEMALEQGTNGQLLGILPGSRSVLSIPITYSDSTLGVLNVESERENAFQDEEVLILRTLADLLATALHNAFIFQKLEQQSITDALTGLKTRRYFNESLQSEFKRALRSGRPFSVVLIDLDKFKEVNDGMGHLEGDLVLARIGRLLDQKVRQSNVVARYGGDEFVILMPETAVDQAQILSERIRLWIATDPMLNERHITGSFGVSTYPLHGSSVEDIFRVADTAMYISKKAGGNKVSITDVTPENISAGEVRQVIASYLEGFLRREHTPTGQEIAGAIQKIAAASGSNGLNASLEAIKAVVRAVETRELHSGGHGEAVSSYAQAMGRELGLDAAHVEELGLAGYVHDIGKIAVPEFVLNKPGPLTIEEYEAVKSHAEVGASILSVVAGMERVQKFVRHHQERFDGTGYPDALMGERIPLGARIIAVAEAFVNMTVDRPYAEGKTAAEAMMELERASGTQFDGALVRLLYQRMQMTAKA